MFWDPLADARGTSCYFELAADGLLLIADFAFVTVIRMLANRCGLVVVGADAGFVVSAVADLRAPAPPVPPITEE